MMQRRRFLQSAAGLGTGIALSRCAQAAVTPVLPTVDFFGTKITKMLVGSNPLYGYTHFNFMYDRMMREFMTPEQRVATLKMAEAAGINTWQFHYNDPVIEDYKRYRAEGGKMNVIMLSDFALHKDWSMIPKVVKEVKPLGLAHHGNRTDERFREGRMDVVNDFIKAVHDAGIPAGVSMHNPHVLDYIEDKGWKNDYYMTCFYRVSRTVEEARAEFKEAPMGETYMEGDPIRMTERVRRTKKFCFGFKILSAGRVGMKPEQIENAFRFALTNIKPTDAVIVGMCPKYANEPAENVQHVLKVMAGLRAS